MKLISLKLTNFMGIKDYTFSPKGKSVAVYGDNATGKTTLYSAFTWLLFDKDSTGAKGFTPKTTTEDGKEVHFLNHCVEGVFDVNGTQVSFGKDFHEVYTQKRGSNTKEMTGHTTDYTVDGVPVNKVEYERRLAELCPMDKSIVLTQLDYFPKTMPWQERRKLLLSVCGDVDDAAVIASNKALSALTKYLKKPGTSGDLYTVDEYRAIAAAQMKKLNAQIEEIPSRVDEAELAMSGLSGVDIESEKAALKANLARYAVEIENLQDQKNALRSTAADKSRQRIAGLEADLSIARNQHDGAWNEEIRKRRAETLQFGNEVYALTTEVNNERSRVKRIEDAIATAEYERSRLLGEYERIRAESYSGDAKCPTCKQALPESDISEATEAFNQSKAERLTKITAEAEKKCSKAIIAGLKDELLSADANYQELLSRLDTAKATLKACEEKMGEKPPVTFESTEEYAKISTELSQLRDELSKCAVDVSTQQNALQAQIDSVNASLAEDTKSLAALESVERQQGRVEELKKQEEMLVAEYEKLKKGVFLCEEFTRVKVSLLNDNINSRFKRVRFAMFEEQINGGLREVCEVLVPCKEGLVPYNAPANNAGRINAGLEIIDTLAEYWGLSVPVFVDNAESVTQLAKVNTQVISLIVSEEHKSLTVKERK